MVIPRDDFRIQGSNFDLTDGHKLLRIICGLFMFPHFAGKFAAGGIAAGTVALFGNAGFNPPELWAFPFRT